MTERGFSIGSLWWMGEIVDIQDPDQEGRVRVRIKGNYDDTTNIPDNMLPWAKPLQSIHSAAFNKTGRSPVGVMKGSTVFGFFLDHDKQYPVWIGTLSKAGDPTDKTSENGNETLVPGTNSTPPGGRLSDNKTITRANQDTPSDDKKSSSYDVYGNLQYEEQKDSDGQDTTGTAIDKTKFGSYPTVAAQPSPSGNILTQLQNIDPQNLNGVLKNAIQALEKIEDLNSFGSITGATNVLGQALGMALNSLGNNQGLGNILNLIATGLGGGSGFLSGIAQQALSIALQSLNGFQATAAVNSVIEQIIEELIQALENWLVQGANPLALNAILAAFLEQIQALGSQATLGNGVTPSNILNLLTQMLPTIAFSIEGSLFQHLPQSVLNIQTVTTAIQKFSMAQAFLKAPNNGKKALAIQATTPTPSIQSLIGGIEGVGQSTINALQKLL